MALGDSSWSILCSTEMELHRQGVGKGCGGGESMWPSTRLDKRSWFEWTDWSMYAGWGTAELSWQSAPSPEQQYTRLFWDNSGVSCQPEGEQPNDAEYFASVGGRLSSWGGWGDTVNANQQSAHPHGVLDWVQVWDQRAEGSLEVYALSEELQQSAETKVLVSESGLDDYDWPS